MLQEVLEYIQKLQSAILLLKKSNETKDKVIEELQEQLLHKMKTK